MRIPANQMKIKFSPENITHIPVQRKSIRYYYALFALWLVLFAKCKYSEINKGQRPLNRYTIAWLNKWSDMIGQQNKRSQRYRAFGLAVGWWPKHDRGRPTWTLNLMPLLYHLRSIYSINCQKRTLLRVKMCKLVTLMY